MILRIRVCGSVTVARGESASSDQHEYREKGAL